VLCSIVVVVGRENTQHNIKCLSISFEYYKLYYENGKITVFFRANYCLEKQKKDQPQWSMLYQKRYSIMLQEIGAKKESRNATSFPEITFGLFFFFTLFLSISFEQAYLYKQYRKGTSTGLLLSIYIIR